ncbi:hypothetical protein PCYB_011920 [Plasmodium cynomolgi strain B]|uniref:Uncharacterized protein n=1 Tax=Plasmodium cynomolgi (strain B) TaxID=1120755 RepID=K6UPE8_PLACD|nr:hypothetical protein PCYB_011920 [Plasmodium cynomolgi strain B]GAB64459.1 hypothetical protein PCYB_011920 [Plasmodium cynomolgi strain B]
MKIRNYIFGKVTDPFSHIEKIKGLLELPTGKVKSKWRVTNFVQNCVRRYDEEVAKKSYKIKHDVHASLREDFLPSEGNTNEELLFINRYVYFEHNTDKNLLVCRKKIKRRFGTNDCFHNVNKSLDDLKREGYVSRETSEIVACKDKSRKGILHYELRLIRLVGRALLRGKYFLEHFCHHVVLIGKGDNRTEVYTLDCDALHLYAGQLGRVKKRGKEKIFFPTHSVHITREEVPIDGRLRRMITLQNCTLHDFDMTKYGLVLYTYRYFLKPLLCLLYLFEGRELPITLIYRHSNNSNLYDIEKECYKSFSQHVEEEHTSFTVTVTSLGDLCVHFFSSQKWNLDMGIQVDNHLPLFIKTSKTIINVYPFYRQLNICSYSDESHFYLLNNFILVYFHLTGSGGLQEGKKKKLYRSTTLDKLTTIRDFTDSINCLKHLNISDTESMSIYLHSNSGLLGEPTYSEVFSTPSESDQRILFKLSITTHKDNPFTSTVLLYLNKYDIICPNVNSVKYFVKYSHYKRVHVRFCYCSFGSDYVGGRVNFLNFHRGDGTGEGQTKPLYISFSEHGGHGGFADYDSLLRRTLGRIHFHLVGQRYEAA